MAAFRKKDYFEVSLLCLGIILSAYLLFHHYEIRLDPSQKSFCTLSSDINCDLVALHVSSEVLGIPLAVYGIGFYAMLLWIFRWSRKTENKVLAAYGKIIRGLGLLISIYLFLISKFVIGSLCLICCLTYLLNLGLFLSALLDSNPLTIRASLQEVFRDLQVR